MQGEEEFTRLGKAFTASAMKVKNATPDLISRTTDIVYVEAFQGAPRRTGELYRSISRIKSVNMGEVKAGVRYSPYLEWGTSETPAQPFMKPAADDGEDFMLAQVGKILGSVL
jgi:HK97 gp10 family phage protein